MPVSVFGHGTSTHDPRLRRISSTVPPVALPTIGLAMLGNLWTSAAIDLTRNYADAAMAAFCASTGVALRTNTAATAEMCRIMTV